MINRVYNYEKVSPSFILDIIKEYNISSIYDPFCGLGLFLNYFKKQNIQVIGNELTSYGYVVSRALNVNNDQILSAEIINEFINYEDNYNNINFEMFNKLYKFSKEQIKWLEYWRNTINHITIEQAGIFMLALYWLISYWLNFQIYKDYSLEEREVKDILQEFLFKANFLIYDNSVENKLFNLDGLIINPFIEADCAYIDFPSLNGYFNTDIALQICEAWLHNQPDLKLYEFYNRRTFQRGESVETYTKLIKEYINSLSNIPLLVIFYHYNNNISLDTFKLIVSEFRKIKEIYNCAPFFIKDSEKSYVILA